MAKAKEMKPFKAPLAGLSTLKALGKNEGANVGLKITLELPANSVDLNKLVRFQKGERIEVSIVPTQGELPLEDEQAGEE